MKVKTFLQPRGWGESWVGRTEVVETSRRGGGDDVTGTEEMDKVGSGGVVAVGDGVGVAALT